jgi:hypothetical protein
LFVCKPSISEDWSDQFDPASEKVRNAWQSLTLQRIDIRENLLRKYADERDIVWCAFGERELEPGRAFS